MQNKSKDCLTRTQGIELVDSFYKSGLKQKEFCSQNNVAYHIVQYWKPIYHKYINSQNSPRFVPVSVNNREELNNSQALPLKITINSNFTIELSIEADLTMLKTVVEVLRTCG